MCVGSRPKMKAPPVTPKQVFTPPTEADPTVQAAASDARQRAMRGGRQSTILSALGQASSSTSRTLLGG